MGLKGESLGLDAKGNIVYEHAGKTDVVFNAETDAVRKFEQVGGKMFAPKVEAPDVVEDPLDLKDNANANFREGVEFKTKPELSFEDRARANFGEPDFSRQANPLPETVPEASTSAPETPVAPRTIEEIPTYQNAPIAKFEDVGGQKMLVLDDKFQEGKQFEGIRKLYAQKFSEGIKSDMNIDAGGPFEGGRIDIVRNPSTGASEVLLNGKEIAKGYIVPNQNSLKLVDAPGIKSGWFFNDTVYERAFKVAKKMAETLSQNPNIIPKK